MLHHYNAHNDMGICNVLTSTTNRHIVQASELKMRNTSDNRSPQSKKLFFMSNEVSSSDCESEVDDASEAQASKTTLRLTLF